MRLLKREIIQSHYRNGDGNFFLPGKEGINSSFPGMEKDVLPSSWIALKNSRNVASFLDPERNCFIKICRRNSFWKSLKRRLCYPRPFRCLAGALRLKELGIPTPEVWYASRYVLVTEFLGKENQFLNQFPVPAQDLLEMLIRLHRGGFFHGDLNYRNLYRTADGRFGLIDLDAVQLYPGLVPFRLRMKDLARIISSGVQAEQIRSWSRIRSLAAEQCALYKEKSSLSCDPDLVTKIVCANLKHAGKRYGIQYYE